MADVASSAQLSCANALVNAVLRRAHEEGRKRGVWREDREGGGLAVDHITEALVSYVMSVIVNAGDEALPE